MAFGGRSPPQSWDLKYGSMSFPDWPRSVIAPALGLKMILDLLVTISIYMGIAYAHLTASHSCDYMGYVRHVGHAARSSKNHNVNVITWARICKVLTP